MDACAEEPSQQPVRLRLDIVASTACMDTHLARDEDTSILDRDEGDWSS
jgi:hypothetical protein